jgi:hypothetical protein
MRVSPAAKLTGSGWSTPRWIRLRRPIRHGPGPRRFTADGEVGPPTIVRPAINNRHGVNYGNLSISSTNEGAYVVSSWEFPFEQNPALFRAAAGGRRSLLASSQTQIEAEPRSATDPQPLRFRTGTRWLRAR